MSPGHQKKSPALPYKDKYGSLLECTRRLKPREIAGGKKDVKKERTTGVSTRVAGL